jgi:hypothetical protein
MDRRVRTPEQLRLALIAHATEPERRRLVAQGGVTRNSTVNRRMLRCRVEVDRTGRRFRCNRPFCPDCFERSRNQRAKHVLLPLAQVAVSEGYAIAHLTIILRPTDRIDDISDLFRSAKRKIAGCRSRLATRHSQGLAFAADGVLEVSLIPDDQLQYVPAGRLRTLSELGFPAATFGGPVWCPHLHLLLFAPPEQGLDEVGEELRRVFPAWRQVHLEAIAPGAGFRRAVFRVARYGAKFKGRTEVPEPFQRNWSKEEMTMALDWAERASTKAFRGLTFTCGLITRKK